VEFSCSDEEKHYYTLTRMKFDYKKHFKEDALAIERELAHPASQWSDQDISLPYKTRRCINKYAMAKKCHRLTP
jgi:hypothetical protein